MAMHMKTLKQNANQINQNYYSMAGLDSIGESVF